MKRSGSAELPLHGGQVPPWLAQRMARLGLAITESIVTHHGREAFLSRLSNPFWFQSFGAVMGMDWHSSGITTSVMGALKRSINPLSKELGIYVCGGKGRYSLQTPDELMKIGDTTGLDATKLVYASRLSAKVDNTAIQDGFQLYLHSFVVSSEGDWTVIQQGMRKNSATARRYHWHSANLSSFIETPHAGICGANQGWILNFTAREADVTRNALLTFTHEQPDKLLKEIRLILPAHHDVREKDVDMKRLGTMLWLAYDQGPVNFEELLLLNGMGPRTLQSLALVSEVINGTPSRFRDPARFSFAHGGKDGHPFPVPTKVYDETIEVLSDAVKKARLGAPDKAKAIEALHNISVAHEPDFKLTNNLENWIEKERNESWKYGGRTVFGKELPPEKKSTQLKIF